ncbi:MAG: ABC transporter permease, partial [Mucilaginibacter polytrichastri]|nr:ABC transporter permease [Mucilaginibacter polytrichastri]
MFSNYIKIAWRNLLRNTLFSVINISGLALGIATCLLIMLYVQNERSYDRFNENADRIYRVTFRGKMNGGEIREANVMPPVAQTLKRDFPEVEQATRIRPYGTPQVQFGDKVFKEDNFALADANIFSVFTLPMLKGDPKTALQQPNTVVITSDVAHKYFGSADPIGKVLFFKDYNARLTVTGVIRPVPQNAHFHFGFFASMVSIPEAREDSWMTSGFYTYLLLPEKYDAAKLEAKLPQTIEKYLGPQLQKAMGVTLEQFRKSGNTLGFRLQPLRDIHLHSDLTGDMEPYGDVQYVYIFTAVAVFMLLIACINFMNLSTAGASKRAREVGVRKVMGSARSQLVAQFMLESLLLTGIAFAIGILVMFIVLPAFNSFFGLQLRAGFTLHFWTVPALLLFALCIGVLAGSYPAFFLSSFRPVSVLKGATKQSGGLNFRSMLVVFQFFISISLIIGTLVVFGQLSFIRNKKLGYNKDHVLVIDNAFQLGNNLQAFKQTLLEQPDVNALSTSGYLPAGNTYSNNYMSYPDGRSAQLFKTLRYEVDEHYLSTLGIKLAAGRNFSAQFGTDSSAVLISETTARAFGWGKNAVGHTLSHTENDGAKITYTVIGVVKDFHFRSLHERITPMIMTLGKDPGSIIVKVNGKNMPALLAQVRNTWNRFSPENPFSYSFLDERYAGMYRAEQHIGSMLGLFAGLTIFTGCLGLFGLVTFTAEQRRKE